MNQKHRREDIIAQGRELFRYQGYHNTGLSDILHECGIPKGTFYNYFNSKESFAIEALQDYSQQIQRLISTYMNFKQFSPAKRLQRFYDQLISLNENEGSDRGCLLMNFSSEVGGLSPQMADAVQEEFSKWVTLLTPTIEEAQTHGQLSTSFEATDLAKYIHTQIFGNMALMKSEKSTRSMKKNMEMAFRMLKN